PRSRTERAEGRTPFAHGRAWCLTKAPAASRPARTAGCRSGGKTSEGRVHAGVRARRSRIHPQIVLDMGDARHVLGDILGPPLVVAAVDLAGEGHLVRLDVHLDARCIERGVVAQPVAHILLDALVRAGVALRAVTAVLVLSPAPLGLLVAEPGRDLVTRLVPEIALLGTAGTIVAGVVFPSAIRLALAAPTGAVRPLIEGRIAPGAGRGEVIARVAARPLVVAAAVAALVIILVGVAAHLPRPFVLAHRSIVAVAIAQVVC